MLYLTCITTDMIPRQYRMKHDKDFEVLFKEGKFFRGTYVSATVWKINTEVYPRRAYESNTFRVGFIVSKKIEKKAVRRSSIKRKMREAVRLLMKDKNWTTGGGYLVAFVASPKALEASVMDIGADVRTILKKTGIV